VNAGELWQRYREWLFDEPELGVRLDLSRMDMPVDYVRTMQPALQRAFEAMQALEAGAIANPDEGRRVGHYWLRAPELAPTPEIAEAIRQMQRGVVSFAADVHAGRVRPQRAERFEHVLLIGIGGSALGPQLVADALGRHDDRMASHFIDNTDPDGIDRVSARLAPVLERVLTLVVSKSGTTPETRNGMLEMEAVYAHRGLDFGRHAVAVTGEGSELDSHAVRHGFLARFPMWDWVGGRTSELSAVGLLPAALQGIDVWGLLDGAARMDHVTRRTVVMQNPAALLALCWFHAVGGRGLAEMVVLPYKDRLLLLGRYLQQLVMESLGKEGQGLTVYGNKGSTDQHAYVQQLREGLSSFFVTFVQILRDREGRSLEVEPGVTSGDYLQGLLLGTRRALYEKGRGSLTLTLAALDPASVGMLIALYERAVGLYASLIHVNAYHQPGVEAGKRAAAAVLELQRRLVQALRHRAPAAATCAELAHAAGADGEIETAFWILERLAANPEHGIVRERAPLPFDATYRFDVAGPRCNNPGT
jgi:glucose-6-phosphate isomerase